MQAFRYEVHRRTDVLGAFPNADAFRLSTCVPITPSVKRRDSDRRYVVQKTIALPKLSGTLMLPPLSRRPGLDPLAHPRHLPNREAHPNGRHHAKDVLLAIAMANEPITLEAGSLGECVVRAGSTASSRHGGDTAIAISRRTATDPDHVDCSTLDRQARAHHASRLLRHARPHPLSWSSES